MTSAKFKIITKEFCPQSKILKEWLSDKTVYWEEIDYRNSILDDSVMKDSTFTANYCEIGGCIETTPIIIKSDSEYYHGEIWEKDMKTINEDKAREIFYL